MGAIENFSVASFLLFLTFFAISNCISFGVLIFKKFNFIYNILSKIYKKVNI